MQSEEKGRLSVEVQELKASLTAAQLALADLPLSPKETLASLEADLVQSKQQLRKGQQERRCLAG